VQVGVGFEGVEVTTRGHHEETVFEGGFLFLVEVETDCLIEYGTEGGETGEDMKLTAEDGGMLGEDG
jgi:hypothetical protein